MKIHYIMHAEFEKIGLIEKWARENGFFITHTKSYQNEPLPKVTEFDFLIVLGGPQSPRDVDQLPYLRREIQLIQEAIQHEKLVLGFCLGAQLISEALGGHTEKSPEKEMGIYPINLTLDGLKDDIFEGFPKQFKVFHWHFDMPEVPKNSTLLASSPGCPVQAFRYSKKVYGFQFHMEVTQEIIQDLIKNCPDDLKPSSFTQAPNDMLTTDLNEMHKLMRMVLDKLITRSKAGSIKTI